MYITIVSFLNTASSIIALLTPWAIEEYNDPSKKDDTITLWDIDEVMKPKHKDGIPVPYLEFKSIMGLMYCVVILSVFSLLATYLSENMKWFSWKWTVGINFVEFAISLTVIILYALNSDDIHDKKDTIKPYFVGFIFTVISMSLSMSVFALGIREHMYLNKKSQSVGLYGIGKRY